MNRFGFTLLISLTVILLSTTAPSQEAAYSTGQSTTWYGEALNGKSCEIGSGYGPYDYTNPAHRNCCLSIVEKNHFGPEVENLLKGQTTALPAGDLDYTLRAFPNHHRALLAMIRFQLLHQNNLPGNLTPAECYLQRAAVFSPNDPNIPFLHGFYLHRKGLYDKALNQYKKSQRMTPDNPTLHYYMAKLYMETGEKGKATQHAKKASSLGISSGTFKETFGELGYGASK